MKIYHSDYTQDLAKAKLDTSTYAVGYGDGGETIYFTVPAKLINASGRLLYDLILTVDEVLWFEDSSREIEFVRCENPPQSLDGLGQILKDEIWFNPKIVHGKELISDMLVNNYSEKEFKDRLIELRLELEKNRQA